MEIKFINTNYQDTIFDFEIKNKTITGITKDKNEDLIKLITLSELPKGKIFINNQKITKQNKFNYQKQISFVSSEFPQYSFILTIEEMMNFIIKTNNLIIRDEQKKIKDSLKIVGLKKDYLDLKISDLSLSEKKLIQIAVSLLSNPELIIIDEPFKNLDMKNEKKLVMLFNRLKEQFNKNIIIISEDSNVLYKYTDNMIFIKNNKIVLEGSTKETYLQIDQLKKHKFEIPDIVEITYLAKKNKNIKLEYHKDVRDIIKDIYKHV